MKFLMLILAFAPLAAPLAGQPAPRVTSTLPPDELRALESVRRAVWVNWFSGDTAALRRVLPPELVTISPDTGGYGTLERNIARSAQYKAAGGEFVSVDFTDKALHRFGDVVVMFSHYEVHTRSKGQPVVQRGRATEVFVRSGGRWVHTSWHLDVT